MYGSSTMQDRMPLFFIGGIFSVLFRREYSWFLAGFSGHYYANIANIGSSLGNKFVVSNH
jgi:hypothetical protein